MCSQSNIQLARDMLIDEEYRHSKWNTLIFHYKHNVFIGKAPAALSAVSTHFTGQFTDFYGKVQKDYYFKELDLSEPPPVFHFLAQGSYFVAWARFLSVTCMFPRHVRWNCRWSCQAWRTWTKPHSLTKPDEASHVLWSYHGFHLPVRYHLVSGCTLRFSLHQWSILYNYCPLSLMSWNKPLWSPLLKLPSLDLEQFIVMFISKLCERVVAV